MRYEIIQGYRSRAPFSEVRHRGIWLLSSSSEVIAVLPQKVAHDNTVMKLGKDIDPTRCDGVHVEKIVEERKGYSG